MRTLRPGKTFDRGKNTMDAIELLQDQHREVEQLFEKIKKAKSEEKEDLFLQLADALATHATIEEKLFYPQVMSNRTDELLQEAVQEHLQTKRLLADMLDLDVSDEKFDAKLRVLQEEVEHHVDEEENELFTDVRKEFPKEMLEKLGAEMQAMAEEVRESEPRNEIPNETDEAAPLEQ